MHFNRCARLALIVAGLTTPAAAGAQTAETLFDHTTVQELRLFMHDADLRRLREYYTHDTYYPADLQWGGVRVRNLGVRSRGLGSRSSTKPGLRIDMNRYVAGQTFVGLPAIALDNLIQDPAFVRERVAMAMFARMGQPAPRESFGRLFINDEYQGVYAIVEPVNAAFLMRTLGENGGYLLERVFAGPYYGEDLGPDPAAYRPLFEPKNHERESDAQIYSPIRDLFHEVNAGLDAVWRERVGRYLDLEQFVTHVAIETFLSEADGVLGFAGMSNFFFYRPGGSERHRTIVWDKDRTFTTIESPILLRADENQIFRRLLAFDDLRTLFLGTLERCARAAEADGWLEREITESSALLRDLAHGDPSKPYSNETHDAEAAFLQAFARRRPAFVLEDVARERTRQWAAPESHAR